MSLMTVGHDETVWEAFSTAVTLTRGHANEQPNAIAANDSSSK